jgi:TIR domain
MLPILRRRSLTSSPPEALSPTESVTPDVFISYSRRDKVFVQRLNAALVNLNRDTWVDWEDIMPTEKWWQAIESGIESANTFVFIISPDSVASSVCKQEIEHAVLHHKRLVPVVCRDADTGLGDA